MNPEHQKLLDESVKLEEDDADYTKLKDQTKSEMLKYLKKCGLDVDNLIKTGVPLSDIKDAMDKLLSGNLSSADILEIDLKVKNKLEKVGA